MTRISDCIGPTFSYPLLKRGEEGFRGHQKCEIAERVFSAFLSSCTLFYLLMIFDPFSCFLIPWYPAH
jgi:hypothetical protein